MCALFSGSEAARKLLLKAFQDRKTEIIERIPESGAPPASFYEIVNSSRDEYFSEYVERVQGAIESGNIDGFLGKETYEGYSLAKNGCSLNSVISVPGLVEKAVLSTLSRLVETEGASVRDAMEATTLLNELVAEALEVRAASYAQTRDEAVRFYHEYQEEVDHFPDNLAATLDFDTLLLSAVKKCRDLLNIERCAFFSRDLLTNDLHLESTSMLEVADDQAVFKLDDEVLQQVVREGKTYIVDKVPTQYPLLADLMDRISASEILLVPLMVRGRNSGIMLLDKTENHQVVVPEMINLAERFANRVAGAMENAELHGSEQRKLKETMALLEVSRLVTSTLDIDVLISRLVQITADVCEVGKCSVYIYLEHNDAFFPTATFGMFPESEWETYLSEGVSVSALSPKDRERIMVSDVAISPSDDSPFMPANRIADTGVKALLLVPISSRENLLGLMVLYYNKEQDEISVDDISLLMAIAGQAAVAMDNATLYENLEMSYFSTVRALAKAIEVKDPYTYGHSERVTDYAVAIANEMGLGERETRNLKYAAALHDIGKLGIAGRILNKPTALNEDEFLQIKTHPEMGDSIMEPVSFLQESREIILHHHERWDGKGYPYGLKGEEIPLGARILTVADSFEAMISDRPYRKALDIGEAVEEIVINSGTQFDPVVVEAFVAVFGDGQRLRPVLEESPILD